MKPMVNCTKVVNVDGPYYDTAAATAVSAEPHVRILLFS
jgi:hypothetical protein